MSSAPSEAPTGDVKDNDYISRTGQYQIPVQKDDLPVTDPIDPATADSDKTLGIGLFFSKKEKKKKRNIHDE